MRRLVFLNPLVSIIVPVYKVPERFLRKCIESLINQTLEDIEIILVDDGSPDNCGQICDEYADRDFRIKVIHQNNTGLSGARNTGFLASNGKWITFVDGDDWIDSDTCLQVTKLTTPDTELVFWTRVKEYSNRSVECPFIKDVEKKIYVDNECKELQKEVLDFNSNISTAYAKLISRDFLLKNNIIHDEELRQGAEGIEFNIRLFENLKKAVFINSPFYHYMYNDTSISARCSEENNYYVIKCFEKIKSFIYESENRDKLLENFYNRMVYVIITTAISGYFHPKNPDSYKIKVKKYMKYLSQPLIKETFENANLMKLSLSRKIAFKAIRNNIFWIVNFMAFIREKQLKR